MKRPSPTDARPATVSPRGSLPDSAAVRALFALGGFVIASWAVRIPDVSTQVGADHDDLGVALLGVSVGALATMRLTGALCERLGPGLVSTGAAVLVCIGVVGPGLSGSVPALVAALLAFGATTGVLNVAMNSLGVRLEAAGGRPVLSSLHAAFSFGGLGGSIVGGLAASVVAPGPHLLGVAGTGLLLASVLAGPLLAADRPQPSARGGPTGDHRRHLGDARRAVVVLGAVAGCTAYGEGALGDWAALHLADDLAATPVWAAAGYACFSLAMASARLAGHRLLDVLGESRLLVGGALLAAVGMLPAALSGDLAPALVGLVLVGLGLANIFPVAIARAGTLGGARGVGLASTVGYAGLLAGPALIGFLAARVGLPGALTSVSALAVLAAGLSLSAGGWTTPATGPAAAAARTAVGDRWHGWLGPVVARAMVAADAHVDALSVLSPLTVPRPGRPAAEQHRAHAYTDPDLAMLLGSFAPRVSA